MDEKRNLPAGQEQDHYQTGSTQPPKSHSGIVALLLVLVVLLTGTVGMLGIQNIRLLGVLNAHNLSSLTDGQTSDPTSPTGSAPTGRAMLGIEGDAVSAVNQTFFQIPAGLYITKVYGNAKKQGIRTGDILLSINGQRITAPGELESVLGTYQVGQNITATFYRNHKQHHVTLTVEAAG